MCKTKTLPSADSAGQIDEVVVRLIEPKEYRRFQDLLAKHHYLGRIKPVGERLC